GVRLVIRIRFQSGGDLVLASFELLHRFEGGEGFVDDRDFFATFLDVLFEIADGKAAAADGPCIRLNFSRNHPKEGRLAGAIRPNEADPLPDADRPREPIEDALAAEGEEYVVELEDLRPLICR